MLSFFLYIKNFLLFVPEKIFLLRILQTAWSVHGLWPTQFGKIAPNFCNTTWKFDYDSVKEIRPDLDIYWPDYEMR